MRTKIWNHLQSLMDHAQTLHTMEGNRDLDVYADGPNDMQNMMDHIEETEELLERIRKNLETRKKQTEIRETGIRMLLDTMKNLDLFRKHIRTSIGEMHYRENWEDLDEMAAMMEGMLLNWRDTFE